MAGDDLHDPLGLDADQDRAPGRNIHWGAVGFGGLAVLAFGLGVFAWATDDGMGGEPFAVAAIEPAQKPAPPPSPPPPAPANTVSMDDATSAIRPPGAPLSADDVEIESGVRVVRQGGGHAPGALIIQVPSASDVELVSAPDRRLVEKGRYGPLPRIGADGSRASDIYARPVVLPTNIKAGSPRVALVVGGMGLSQTATRAAIAALPGAVTLAFAPYGLDLDRQAAAARAGGHEIVLQLPMEPFEGGEMPGEKALRVSLEPDEIADRLQWLLSRFTGYVGVENFLGARYTAREASILPVLREVERRGLLYLDDGSSPQSLAPSLGASNGMAMARADVALDAQPDALAPALARLEAIAREKGTAIGAVSGLPANVEEVARFARGLEKRGVALVPLSAVVVKAPQPSASIAR